MKDTQIKAMPKIIKIMLDKELTETEKADKINKTFYDMLAEAGYSHQEILEFDKLAENAIRDFRSNFERL